MSGQDPSSAVARYLVSCAARKAPPGLAARLEEEWLADLAVRQGAFSRIRFGLGCCWATRVIAREFGAAAAGAASAASGQRLLVAYGGYDFSRFSRRTLALIAIVFLHVAILYAYLNGAPQRIVDSAPAPINGAVILDHRTFHRPEPPLPPKLTMPRLDDLPTPRIPPNVPVDPRTITAPHTTLSHLPPMPIQGSKPVARVTGGPGAGFPDTENYYPPAARRLGEAGAAAVRVCVDSNGRLTADPAIIQSSGIARIDGGALRLARAGSGHYRPTTENGKPVSSCYAFRVRFRLEDE
ncbi:MAG TPA: TonB family protein [Steroidobacteraceae bacterium]|nr:TonB family protein [Steroidobacteraceae bacterium]